MTTITTAFADAVHDSQACFRRLLTAMAEPGTRVQLDRAHAFGAMNAGAVQVLLTLADHHTRLWLSPALQADTATLDNLRFHVGAPLVSDPAQADFAVLAYQDTSGCEAVLEALPAGTEEYPDQGATLVLETDSLDQGVAAVLSGPGIPGQRSVCLGSLPPALVRWLSERDPRSPLGLDLILVYERELIAIPRSTQVEV
ncbi:phosphonate C-P lyase system protein PhnH [Oceanimonas sp. MB9]|uniref:phosphonate C-P lyase system protein PhnH n=1 Tax=Oceanimonas sp. MB9 TaxID=2588453 RepID=UPI0013F5ADFF|nr:phosphonate C-P lyase system protein PhnH [Oceanimonas sp. MB9]NHH99266.1 Alpha-D-ribose 1-methylphosphonate 5-triphosphate synthase subunit PhnH [Oceanimonas sp. MB9]